MPGTPLMIPTSRSDQTEKDLAEKRWQLLKRFRPLDMYHPEELMELVEPFKESQKEDRFVIRDILRKYFRQYVRHHRVDRDKRKAVYAMMACGTGGLGYNLVECPECGQIRMRACSCGNRNCTACGWMKRQQWIALRQAEIIEGIPYFHIVFTIPDEELNPLILHNQKALIDLHFRAVKETLLALSASKLNMIPGIMMVAHSFGSTLVLHQHIHYDK